MGGRGYVCASDRSSPYTGVPNMCGGSVLKLSANTTTDPDDAPCPLEVCVEVVVRVCAPFASRGSSWLLAMQCSGASLAYQMPFKGINTSGIMGGKLKVAFLPRQSFWSPQTAGWEDAPLTSEGCGRAGRRHLASVKWKTDTAFVNTGSPLYWLWFCASTLKCFMAACLWPDKQLQRSSSMEVFKCHPLQLLLLSLLLKWEAGSQETVTEGQTKQMKWPWWGHMWTLDNWAGTESLSTGVANVQQF